MAAGRQPAGQPAQHLGGLQRPGRHAQLLQGAAQPRAQQLQLLVPGLAARGAAGRGLAVEQQAQAAFGRGALPARSAAQKGLFVTPPQPCLARVAGAGRSAGGTTAVLQSLRRVAQRRQAQVVGTLFQKELQHPGRPAPGLLPQQVFQAGEEGPLALGVQAVDGARLQLQRQGPAAQVAKQHQAVLQRQLEAQAPQPAAHLRPGARLQPHQERSAPAPGIPASRSRTSSMASFQGLVSGSRSVSSTRSS